MDVVKVLTLSIALLSGSVCASAMEWKNGSIDSELSPFKKLKLFEDGLNRQNVGVLTLTRQCTGADEAPKDTLSYRINGIKVKYLVQCVGKRQRMEYPATDKGTAFLLRQLKYRHTITFEQIGSSGYKMKFSAKGFAKELAKFKG